MRLIVGLGNPGEKYLRTRHNIGYKIADKIAKDYNFLQFKTKPKFQGDIIEIGTNESKIIVLKPTTFMNLSGESVLATARFYSIDHSEIIVVHDELDFDFGRIELKESGEGKSSHNGVRSIVASLKTADFQRIRFGIKNSESSGIDSADFVLSRWSEPERQKLPKLIEQAVNLVL